MKLIFQERVRRRAPSWYYYNPKDDKFYVGKISDGKVAPKNIQELLSNPDFRRGIDKGLNYLGEKK